ncbi:hypothetical protein GCM10010191_23210 [Actinomadura vinacea]|uniref:Leucine-rich repeat domain-containing protein n=1 Tax=Actinomadura vinacea TaxID=115336 RepID=A0ABN3ISK6_9ACTN
MAPDEPKPALFANRWGDALPPGGNTVPITCQCFDQHGGPTPGRVPFHRDRQDTSSPGWRRLLALIEDAAEDGRAVFRPFAEMTAEERRAIVTLPPSIAKLTAVEHLVLYGSNLVRIPPEIGAMTALEEFTPYTSHRLHWFPYEITRCAGLRRSTVSTRSLYGNFKMRPPFPELKGDGTDAARVGEIDGASSMRMCSVCRTPLEEGAVRQVWISLQVATDVLPLLVNACSVSCVEALPEAAEGYVPTPHTGGPGLTQPSSRYY